MSSAAPVDADVLDDVGLPVDWVALALADDEALLVGDAVDEALAEELAEAEDNAMCVDVGLVHGVEVDWAPFLPVAPGSGSLLGLLSGDGVGVAVGVTVELAVTVEVALALAEALALELALLPLRVPLDDVAGAVVVSVAVLGELVLVCVADWCAEADGQDVVLPLEARPPARPVDEPPSGDGAGELPSPSVRLVLPVGLGLVKA